MIGEALASAGLRLARLTRPSLSGRIAISGRSDGAKTEGEPGLARRLRFRDSLGRLAQRGQAIDLLRVVLVPGASLIVAGIALMIIGWTGAAHTFRSLSIELE